MKFLNSFVLALAMSALTACSSDTTAIWDTMRDVASGKRDAVTGNLNPNFRYLRITVGGRSGLVALGNEDGNEKNPVEVWYGGQREVLRLQAGRVVGVTGLPTEWRRVELPEIPTWSAVARGNEAVRWVRTRDVMPGYRYGVREEMVLRTIPVPRKSELMQVDPQQLAWFEESVARVSGAEKALPAARYAVDLRDGKQSVVYAEQCIAMDLCIAWQRWPPQK
jgi:hypothetical protein